jgi:hypothetical protein
MKNTHRLTLATLLCISAGLPIVAAEITPSVLDQSLREIGTRFKRERASCYRLAPYERSICLQVAEGQEQLERAELAERYQPSDKHRFQLAMAREEARHARERQRCQTLELSARAPCMERAREDFMTGKADALISHRRTGPSQPGNSTAEQPRGEAAHCRGPSAQHRQHCQSRDRHEQHH